jgi:hypothetical protein
VPTILAGMRGNTVGTLRFAHPTAARPHTSRHHPRRRMMDSRLKCNG